MKFRLGWAVAIILAGVFLTELPTNAAIPDNPKGETVQFTNGKENINGYLALPAAKGKFPAVLLIHEWWGLNDWIKENADKLAAQGYVALAVDLYRGKVATDAESAHELMRAVPQDLALKDMEGAIGYLAKRDDVVKQHIAVIGWCWGGGQAMELAVHQPGLAGVVVNYGALPTDPNDLQQIGAPILGNFGADDRGITPNDVHDFEKSMKALNRYVDVKIYPGAGHAFENPNNQEGYRAEAAADAWQRTLTFLNKALH